MFDSAFRITRISGQVRRFSEHFMVFILNGNLNVTVNDDFFNYSGSAAVLVSPGDFYHIRVSNSLESSMGYAVTLDESWLDRISDDGVNLLECFYHTRISKRNCIGLGPEQFEDLKNKAIRSYCLSMSDEYLYGNRLELKLSMTEMMLTINRCYRDMMLFTSKNKSLAENDDVYRITEYIKSNYWDEISIEGLSIRFGINRNRLCHMFRDLVGISPIRYLINYRLSCACSFLSSGYSVEETCSKSGFCNLPHFSKTFKRHYGIGPKQYQMLYRDRRQC